MPRLKGVYWDLDGTIANTELEAHLPAFNKTFSDLGLNWYWDNKTYINLLKINGGKNRLTYYSNLTDSKLPEEYIIKIHKTKQKNYLSLIENGSVTLKTGVYRLINELMYEGVKQFIVTSSSKIQVDLLVKILFSDIKPFEFIIASDDVDLKKPNPEPYLKAIALSNIKESNSLVFEDSNPGIKSALRANLPTICIKSNIPINIDDDINLKCFINSLGDKNNKSEILFGPKLYTDFIDYKFLNDFINES